MKSTDDLNGIKFNMLTAIRPNGKTQDNRTIWLVRCDCGIEKNISAKNLVSLKTKSCGCSKKKSAQKRKKPLVKSQTYWRWNSMIQRCTNRNQIAYKKYGESGISVCERWKIFDNFLEDIGVCPKDFSLDRIDNSKGYEPSNCRWVKRSEQSRNRKTCKLLFFRGKEMRLWEIAELTGISHKNIQQRIKSYRMTLDEAVSIPLRKKIPTQYGDFI